MSLKLHYNPNSKKKMIVEFSNGVPVDDSELICKLYQVNKETNEQVLFVKGNTVNYVGNNFSSQFRHPNSCKYALAKINKKTQKAKLYETNLFKLKPVLNEVTQSKRKASSGSKKTYAEKQFDLVNSFGSKLVKKRLQVPRAVDESSMKDVLKVMNNPDFVLADKEENVSPELLIPYNKSATCAEELYPLYQIISQSVLNSVENKAKQFMKPSPQDYNRWENESGAISSEYVQQCVRRLNVFSEKDALESFTILQVIVYLIDLGNLQRGGLKKKCLDLLPHISTQFHEWVKEKFFDSGKTFRKQLISSRSKDVLHATVIILAWHLDGFSSNFKLIRPPITVSTNRFRKIVQAVGGVIQGANVRLKYPMSNIDSRITAMKTSRRK